MGTKERSLGRLKSFAKEKDEQEELVSSLSVDELAEGDHVDVAIPS